MGRGFDDRPVDVGSSSGADGCFGQGSSVFENAREGAESDLLSLHMANHRRRRSEHSTRHVILGGENKRKQIYERRKRIIRVHILRILD